MFNYIHSKYTIVIIFVFTILSTQAQKYYISPSISMAAGKTKQILGSGYGIEVGNLKGFYYGSRSRSYLSFDYLKNPKNNKTIGIYDPSEIYDTTIYQLTSYLSGTLGYGLDFSPIKTGKVNVYYGLDIHAGFMSYKFKRTETSLLYDPYIYEDKIASITAGVRGRIGVEYPIKKSAIALEVSRTTNIGTNIFDTHKLYSKEVSFHSKLNISLLFRW